MKLNTTITILVIGLFVVSILNFFDGLTTYIGITQGLAQEANPFMKSFAEDATFWMFMFKIVASIGLMVFGIYMDMNKEKILKDYDRQKKRHIAVLGFSFIMLIVTTAFYTKVLIGNIGLIL